MGGTQRDSKLRSTVDSRCHRRAFLFGAGVTLAGTAGCIGTDGNDPGETDNSTDATDDGAEYAAGSGPAEVIAWNRELFDIIRFTNETPTETVRRLGILTTAMFDAATTVTAARGQSHYEPYGSYDGAPADGSPLAALGGAAHEALGAMYPELGDGLDNRLSGTLAVAEGSDGDVDAGEQWGRSVGQQAVQRRADDGHDQPGGEYEPCPDAPTGTPGCWGGGSLGTWRDSHYALLDTWVLDEPVTFDGPPPLDSGAYTEGWQEVYDIGDDRNRSERPQEHIDIARYWRGGAGTTRPSGRWLRIANIAVGSGEFDLTALETARLMALVALAVGDAGISGWHGKHEHDFWRPAEAIAAGDTDGNPDTFADTDWESIAIGSSPEYPSSLAAFAGAGQTVLERVLGTDDFAFEMTSSGPPELTRSFESFSEAAAESVQSRLYVGNHFPFSLADGRTAGETIGETVLDSVLRPVG